MTCTSTGFYEWDNQIPITFDQWKTILSRIPINEQPKCLSVHIFIIYFFFFYFHRLSSSSDLHNHRSTTQLKKPERSIFGRSQVYNDGLTESFLVSSTLSLSQQGMKNTNIDKFISEFL